MKKHIPNFITLLNLLSGTIAVMLAVQNQLELAALFVFLGIVFDFFDGFAARMLKVSSELGVQLDSLADMVTCGVVPGIVMFQLLNDSTGTGWATIMATDMPASWLPYVGLLIPMASAYRLAKFNIDERQTDSFIGLPTPANALLILSLPLIVAYQNNDLMNTVIYNPWFLVVLSVVSSYMLNAENPLFSLKIKTLAFQPNAHRYSFLLLSVVLLILLWFAAIPLIIVMYVLMSLFMQKRNFA